MIRGQWGVTSSTLVVERWHEYFGVGTLSPGQIGRASMGPEIRQVPPACNRPKQTDDFKLEINR